MRHLFDSYLNTFEVILRTAKFSKQDICLTFSIKNFLQDDIDYESLICDLNWYTTSLRPAIPVVVPVKVIRTRVET